MVNKVTFVGFRGRGAIAPSPNPPLGYSPTVAGQVTSLFAREIRVINAEKKRTPLVEQRGGHKQAFIWGLKRSGLHLKAPIILPR